MDINKFIKDNKIDLTSITKQNDFASKFHEQQIKAMNNTIRQIDEARMKDYMKEEQYKNSVLNALQNIEKNTGNLYEIAYLLKEGNVARDEIYLLFEKMFSILNAKSYEEAEDIYKSTMQTVTNINTTADVISKLSNFGKMILDTINNSNQAPF